MNKKLIIGIVVTLIVIGSAVAAYFVSQNAGAPASQTPAKSSSQAAATITYSDSGFSPSSTTVKAGDTVAIKNSSSNDLQFDSDPHPVHTDDTELNVGTVASGQTVTFTVTTKGTFGFHNHLNPGDKGSITIQ